MNPPWGEGFVWEETLTGKPWIGVVCEENGADIWWPCKDHPSDEPDSMSMSFTVPNPLVCVSNGKLVGSIDNGNNTTTYNWYISQPINNYNVSIYVAEFSQIEDTYLSVNGDTIPFYFWVLPEYYNTAVDYMDVFLTEFNFLESICGPFPFGADKHGWAHAPYWGMEHQTIIAYGHNFSVNNWGFDYIHYHELAHEWWGNLITAKDWADIWIHEGLASYAEALYVEHLSGMSKYHQYMDEIRPEDNHTQSLAPREALTAAQAFENLNPYNRGSSVMHTLRYHLGDEAFFNLLKRWAYPDSEDLDNTNERFCRILTTDDMKNLAEEVTSRDLDPFFEVFFREISFPVLHVVRKKDSTTFSWKTESNILLDVNIPILVNGMDQTIEMIDGLGNSPISISDSLVIDPKKWILMAEPFINISPTVDAGDDKELTCITASVQLDGSGNSNNGNINLTYTWSGPDSFSSNIAAPIVSVSGTYILTVTDCDNRCEDSDEVEVTLNSTSPTANAGNDKELTCTTTTVRLDGSGNFSGVNANLTYSWSGPNSYSSGIAAPTVSTPGIYILTVTDTNNGCEGSDEVKITQDIDYRLAPNFPNPFNVSTTIKFSIPESQFVTLKVFNFLGSEIITLVKDELNPGIYEITFDGSNLSSGTYFYCLQAGNYTETRRFFLNN